MLRCSIVRPAESRPRHESDSYSCYRPEICMSIFAGTVERPPDLKPIINRQLAAYRAP